MCPALGKQICTVCCGTKRQVEIHCPSDCSYLVAAREHPPVATVRKQQRDLETVVRFMRDLSERQSRLFLLILTFLARYQPPELHPLIDEDVAEAVLALGATFETSAKGVIYEHRPAALSAERLASALKPVLAEAGQAGGSAFERDAAVVLRRVESAAREAAQRDLNNRRAFVELLGRIIDKKDDQARSGEGDPGGPEAPRVIIP
jgi:hypothetical protein